MKLRARSGSVLGCDLHGMRIVGPLTLTLMLISAVQGAETTDFHRGLALFIKEQKAYVWDSLANAPIRQLGHATKKVSAVSLSPDGKHAAIGYGYETEVQFSKFNAIQLIDCKRGTLVRELKGHGRPVTSLEFSKDGRLLVSTGKDRRVRLWRVEDGSLLLDEEIDRTPPQAALSADGSKLVGWTNGRVTVWDTRRARRIFVHDFSNTRDGYSLMAVGYSPDLGLLATSALQSDSCVRLWDVADSREHSQITGHRDAVTGIVVSGDKRKLITVSLDKYLCTWDIHAGKQTRQIQLPGPAQLLLVNATDTHALVGWSPKKDVLGLEGALLVDLQNGKELARFQNTGYFGMLNSFTFSGDGLQLLYARPDGKMITILDVRTGKTVRKTSLNVK